VRNIVRRIVLWFVAVPLLIAIIVLLPYQNHLAFNVLVVAASALAAFELKGLFEKKDAGYRASRVVIPALGGVLPLCELLILNDIVPPVARELVLYSVPAVTLLLQVLRREHEGFRHTLTNAAANIVLLIYPGLFMAYLVRLSTLEPSSIVILTFLCVVFFNDTMAYLAGMAYRGIRTSQAARQGREWTPRFVLPVSPKKTLVGFLGGLVMAVATLLVSSAVFPDAFDAPLSALILLGLAVGVATIIGDLIESALKRSATSKDSGSLIPGRGGVLDSIDSVLYAAPVFYYLFRHIL
jgi:phosphatidate cytidylyltransferase